jgi:hypothetical protein
MIRWLGRDGPMYRWLDPQPDSFKTIPSRRRHEFNFPAAVLSTRFPKISVISVHQ